MTKILMTAPNEQHHKVRAWIESQAFGEEAKRTVAREQDSPSFNLPGSASNDDWTLYHNNNDDASGPHDSTLTNEQRNKIHCSLPDSGVNQSSGKSMSSTAMQVSYVDGSESCEILIESSFRSASCLFNISDEAEESIRSHSWWLM